MSFDEKYAIPYLNGVLVTRAPFFFITINAGCWRGTASCAHTFSPLPRRHRRPYLYFAWQRPWVHLQKTNDHFAQVFGLDFPCVLIIGGMVVEMRLDRAGHDGGHFDAFVPDIQHDSLGKTNQAEFAGIIGCPSRKKISASQTGNGDEITFGINQCPYARFDCMEHTSQVDINDFAPLFGREFGDGGKVADASVGNQHIQLTEPGDGLFNGLLLRP